ncbi:hypothetical protein MN202_20095, partial [Rheinheimera muenzenbergensis]
IKKGLPASESSAGVVRSFGYDAFSRLTSNTVQIDGEQFSQHYQYHSQSGQLLSRSYPNGLKLAYEYNDFGYVEWEKNAASGYVYRQHIAQDAFGNITQANLGNGVTEYRHYDSATGWVQSLEARVGGVAVHELNYTNYDNFGNLRGYSNGATGVNESYIYDNLHRLESQTTSAAGVSAAVSFTYDAVGNLLSKSDYGNNYQYGNRAKNLGGNAGANAVRRVTKTDGSTVNFSYDNEGNLISGDGLTISYNSFKQPTQISRGSSTFSFTYGANLERLKEVRDGLTTYEIDKAYEQSSDGSWKVYLDEVAIVSHNSEDGHRIAYSHKDRLGSSITFTDHNGQVTGRRHYDAFGKPRAISGALMEPAHRPRQINFTDIAGISNAGITRRGFTDHRHLDEAELIHMNGRAYDYNLGRFLSVDPFIQSPSNSQSLNPYSYIMNNPLAGTDPTGYIAVENCSSRLTCSSTAPTSKGEVSSPGEDFTITNGNGDTLSNSGGTLTLTMANGTEHNVASLKANVSGGGTVDIEGQQNKTTMSAENNISSEESVTNTSETNLKINRLNDQVDSAEASKAKESEYSITLVAHLDKKTDLIGHAFVIFRGPNGEFAKGFWPKYGASENDFILDAPLEGALSDEESYYSRFKSWQATGADPGKQGGQFASRSFGLTKEQYQNGVSAISNWNSTPYRGRSRMCGSFATHVLRATGQSYGNSKTPYFLFYDMGGSFDKN